MSNLENNILNNNPTIKPKTYCRYVAIFVITKDTESLLILKPEFERNSVLKFTHEPNVNNKINFLDVHVDATNHHILCSTFTKPTNSGVLLNNQGECPQRYKDATIRSLIHRTYKISSNWQVFRQQINKLKQTFINNSYPNYLFDNILLHYLSKVTAPNPKDYIELNPPYPGALVPPIPGNQPNDTPTTPTSVPIVLDPTNHRPITRSQTATSSASHNTNPNPVLNIPINQNPPVSIPRVNINTPPPPRYQWQTSCITSIKTYTSLLLQSIFSRL